jgi:hypothetical protein
LGLLAANTRMVVPSSVIRTLLTAAVVMTLLPATVAFRRERSSSASARGGDEQEAYSGDHSS